MEFGNYVQTGSSTKDIGSGCYGTVYTWYRKDDKSVVYAGKLVRNKNWNAEEVQNLKRCNHVNVLTFVDIVIQPKTRDVLLVTELLNSSLFDALRPGEESMYTQRRCGRGVKVIREKFDPPLNREEITNIISGCFSGLSYLHADNVMHRDISSANILLEVKVSYIDGSRTVLAKYGDFGLAKLFNEERQPSTQLTNAFYSAPEAGGDAAYDGFAADTYSLGVVIIEAIMTYSNNWGLIERQYARSQTFESVRKRCFDTIRPFMSVGLFNLVESMVSLSRFDRPLIDNEIYNRWLKLCDEAPVAPDGMHAVEEPEANFEESVTFLSKVEELRTALPTFSSEDILEIARKHFLQLADV